VWQQDAQDVQGVPVASKCYHAAKMKDGFLGSQVPVRGKEMCKVSWDILPCQEADANRINLLKVKRRVKRTQ
jgi:hypothetical protein